MLQILGSMKLTFKKGSEELNQVYTNEELIRKYRETGDEFLISDLYRQTERLLQNISRNALDKYSTLFEWSVEDLASELNIVWLNALKTFSLSKSVKFTTYLSKCCYRRLSNMIEKNNVSLSHRKKMEILYYSESDCYGSRVIIEEDNFDAITKDRAAELWETTSKNYDFEMDLFSMKNNGQLTSHEFQHIWDRFINMKTLVEIANEHGSTHQAVSTGIKRGLIKLKKRHEQDIGINTYEMSVV